MTGTEMKSMRKPRRRRPQTRMMQPERKVRRTAYSGPCWACRPVMRAMMAVGPMVMSLELPSKMYTKHPMKAEYSPYWGGRPAIRA